MARIIVAALHFHVEQPSGSARLAWEEARFLSDHGHKVWLVAQAKSDQTREVSVHEGVTVLLYPPVPPYLQGLAKWYWHQQRVKSLVQRCVGDQVDVLVGHAPLQSFAAHHAGLHDARVVYTAHSPVRLEHKSGLAKMASWKRIGHWAAEQALAKIERNILSRAETVVVHSEFMASTLRREHPRVFKKKPIEIVPAWISAPFFAGASSVERARRQMQWPSTSPVVFTLRRLVLRTGVDRLLRATALLIKSGRDLFLAIAGSGPLLPELRKLAHELGIEDHVQFMGFVHEEDLPALYGAADLFVIPTAELEGFGLIALEALACGTPVCATPVGALPEVLGKLGCDEWLARDASPEQLAHTMATILDDLSVNRLRAKRARALLQDLFSADRVLMRLEHMMGVR